MNNTIQEQIAKLQKEQEGLILEEKRRLSREVTDYFKSILGKCFCVHKADVNTKRGVEKGMTLFYVYKGEPYFVIGSNQEYYKIYIQEIEIEYSKLISKCYFKDLNRKDSFYFTQLDFEKLKEQCSKEITLADFNNVKNKMSFCINESIDAINVKPTFYTQDYPYRFQETDNSGKHLDIPHKKLDWGDYQHLSFELRQFVLDDILLLTPKAKEIIKKDMDRILDVFEDSYGNKPKNLVAAYNFLEKLK